MRLQSWRRLRSWRTSAIDSKGGRSRVDKGRTAGAVREDELKGEFLDCILGFFMAPELCYSPDMKGHPLSITALMKINPPCRRAA